MTRTAVLTSKKNYAWQSMQEIIPFIESIWLDTADESHDVELINIDDSSVLKNVINFMNIDNIVMTCFTVEIAIGVSALRSKLGLDFKIIFYVHGMATISYWPLFKFQLGDHLRKSDVFIVTCEGDKKLTQASIPNITILKHPFLNNRDMNLNTKGQIRELVYIGRISEQKNIHVLVQAIYSLKNLLRSEKIVLRIFGEEDNLGSPNMGILSHNYKDFLDNMIAKLEIGDLVLFEGHVKRDTIDNYLEKTHCLYISTSLHSDENFGMSPFNILNKGGKCLLTNWGGFSEFKEHFNDQVEYIDVNKGIYGPFIRVDEISDRIESFLEDKHIKINKNVYYSTSEIVGQLKAAAKAPKCLDRVTPSKDTVTISQNREAFYICGDGNSKNHGSQIFKNYLDELAIKSLNKYIGNNEPKKKNRKKDNLHRVDWISMDKNKISINDPRVGVIEINRTISNENFKELSDQELIELYELGYLY